MESFIGKDAKSKREFFSSDDVTRFFEENPRRLIMYVQMGIFRNVPIVSIHIAQLARMVGIPLQYGRSTFKTLPVAFMNPNSFDNISTICAAASETAPH